MNENYYLSSAGAEPDIRFTQRLCRGARVLFAIFGALALAGVLFAATGGPRKVEKWLADAPYDSGCQYIALLPGGGVPSPHTLMRIYKTAEEYKKNPFAKVIVTLKAEQPISYSSTLMQIKEELKLRGVPEEAIILEPNATSTAGHAKYIKEGKIGDPENDKYLLVTSPTHIKRSVIAFEAAGFKKVYASVAWPADETEDLGEGQFFRYKIWNSLQLEIETAREIIAIAYYKLTGRG